MNKLFLAFCLTAVTGLSALAQLTDDFRRSEFYVGYTNNQVETGADTGSSIRSFFRDREGFSGVQVSGVANVSRYVGIKGDVSVAMDTQDNRTASFATGGRTGTVRFNSRQTVLNFLTGLQIKNNAAEGRVKPFAHMMIGAGVMQRRNRNVTCASGGLTAADCANFEPLQTDTGLAGAFGGGLDVRAGSRMDIRLVQIDYNPIRFSGSNTMHNLRIGVGFVIR